MAIQVGGMTKRNIATAAFALTLLGCAVKASLWAFQTRAQAIEEHGVIDQKIEVKHTEAAGQLKAQGVRNEDFDKRLNAQGEVLLNIDTNIQRIMWDWIPAEKTDTKTKARVRGKR